jgi:hypothetical protein
MNFHDPQLLCSLITLAELETLKNMQTSNLARLTERMAFSKF